MTDGSGAVWAALVTGIFGLLALWMQERRKSRRRQVDSDDLINRLDARNAQTILYLQGQLDAANLRIRELTNQLTKRGGDD